MAKETANNNLHWLLLRVSLQAKLQLLKIAEARKMSYVQMFTLLLLEPGAALPMHSISGLLGCDPSNVTAIVDRLTSLKYIVKGENPLDRRVKAISLTTSGNTTRTKILQELVDKNTPDAKALTAAEAKTLQKLLLKIAPIAAATN